jgi:hypothetical protein
LSELPPHDPETMLRIQQFAEQALEELAQRGEADGMDPVQFHLAICIATMGYLANRFGPERAADLIDQLGAMIRKRAPQ